jgi:signal transduction histidine kinase
VVSIDPKRSVRAMADVALDVQRVLVDGAQATPTSHGEWQLPAGSRDLQIDYTAPGARIAERVRFRYRLEGPDGLADAGARDGGGWREVGSRRQAFFTNLAPGRYRFHLQASDDGGPWSSQPAVVTMALAPTLTQTWWFRVGVVLVAALMVAGIVALRLRHVAAREREKLMVRLQERERIAQDLHDTLLQGVLSLILRFQGFVRRLPEGERAGLQQVLDDADALWTEGRNRVKDLRLPPPEAGSVEQSLRRLGEGLAQSHDTAFHLRVEGDARPLDPLLSAELCLVAREAIFNAFQHARALRVDVVVQHGANGLRVEVRDDGVGIPEAVLQAGARDGHWGLTGMRKRAERAGVRFELASRDGGGTTVRVDLPTEA